LASSMHSCVRTMRPESLLAIASTLRIAVAASALLATARFSLSAADLRLEARLDQQKSQIYVALRNEDDRTYLVQIGSLCGPKGKPGFDFTLQRKGEKDERLYLSYNEVGVTCGGPTPWVTVLPKRSEYGFRFSLQSLRLMSKLSSSVADLPDKPYAIVVTYSCLSTDSFFVTNWSPSHITGIPIWTGSINATVSK